MYILRNKKLGVERYKNKKKQTVEKIIYKTSTTKIQSHTKTHTHYIYESLNIAITKRYLSIVLIDISKK